MPDISVLCELSSILGVSVDELLNAEKKENTRIKIEEVANEKNILNLFNIGFIISAFACAFGALLGGFCEVYSAYSFPYVLFYNHWEIIFLALSFTAVVFGNLLFYASAVRLNVIYDKKKIIKLTYKKGIILLCFSYVFAVTFLFRVADRYLHLEFAEITVIVFITAVFILSIFLAVKKIK